MAQINFRIDDDTKTEAEKLFTSLGMNTTTALTIFIRQSLSEHAIPFAIRQTPEQVKRAAAELDERIADLEARRNCHVHELINAGTTTRPRSLRRSRRAKTVA